MFTDSAEPLAIFWDALLSREPGRISRMFQGLDMATRKGVIAHLERMVSEDGWLAEQRTSAQVALDVIQGRISGA